jgi:hypothetical protein
MTPGRVPAAQDFLPLQVASDLATCGPCTEPLRTLVVPKHERCIARCARVRINNSVKLQLSLTHFAFAYISFTRAQFTTFQNAPT